jgi:hypothetical protein
MQLEPYKKGGRIMKTIVCTLFVVFILLNGTVLFADSTWVGDTTISGGIWTSENSPICVDGDIRVASLEIKQGVSVIFFGNYKFEVTGTLKAIGTEQDSIIFRRALAGTGWQRIWFKRALLGSELAYCRIEGATNHGIVVDTCQPTIRNCTITNNSAPGGIETGGGGISIHSNLPLTLTDCIISNNSVTANGSGYAFGWGGGIFCTNAPLTLTNCIISNNSVTAYAGSNGGSCYSYGGGIYSDTTLILHKCSILSNSLNANTEGWWSSNAYARGGGIWAYRGLTLTNCLIDSNLSSATGWGAYINNYARGGGIYIIGNSTVKNSIVSCNTSSAGTEYTGGGIYVVSDTLNLINSTIASNTHEGLTNEGGTVTAMNSIVYFNTDAQIFGNATVTYSDVQGGYTGEGNIDYSPVFKGDCGSNLIIVPPSPCIDSGNPDPIYNDVCFPPSLGTERNDMGAHGGPFGCCWQESPTDKPILVSPASNSSGEVNTTYTWRSVLGATEYQFQLDTSDVGDFVNPVKDTAISDTFYTVSGLDPNEVKGMNWWRVRGKNPCGEGPWSDPFEYTDVKDENYHEIPSQFSLNQNYPNPFNPQTKLEFTLSKGCHVRLDIYNILGERIRALVDEHQTAGYKTVSWDGKDYNGNEVPTGVYFYRIKAGEFTQAKKMVLLK